MFYPGISIIKDLDRKYNRIPIYKKLNIKGLDLLALLKALQNEEQITFLESARANKTWSRFSFFGLKPEAEISFNPPSITVKKDNVSITITANIFDYLKEEIDKFQSPTFPDYGNFNGGYIGYLAYEVMNYTGILRKPLPENNDLSLARFVLVDDFIVFDNELDQYYLATCLYCTSEDEIEAEYKKCQDYLTDLEQKLLAKIQTTTIPYLPAQPVFTRLNYTTDTNEFLDNVIKLKGLISAGEVIQTVISRRAEIQDKIEPYQFYLKLRSLNPSPYMFFLKFSDLTITGSSPEIHVKIEGKHLYLKPIAGTVPRGNNQDEVIANKEKLLADPKERAEHLMLVDLARNDLSRVARENSVKVSQFMEPEEYSHVIHLVSLVEADLADDKHVIDALRESFPAGTVSGAPKVRAMEIIAELEPHPRDIYAGAVGFIGFNHFLDTCITIRTAVFTPRKQYIQAGAGIVYDSQPGRELEEITNKLRALTQSLDYAHAQN